MKKSILSEAFLLIPGSSRKEGMWVVVLLVFSALLDLFSIAAFFPLLLVVTDQQQLGGDTPLADLYRLSSLNNPVYFSVLITLSVMMVIVLKTIINNYVTRRKAVYAYRTAQHLGSMTMHKYMQTSYVQFSKLDYTSEMNRISNLPLKYANNFIIPAGTFLSELIIVSIAMVVLAVYEIKLLFFMLVILLPMGLIFRMNRRKIKKTSEEIKRVYPELLKRTMEGVEGLLEIRAFSKEKAFHRRFEAVYKKIEKIFAFDHALHISASRTTELLVGICVIVMVLYVLLTGKSSRESMLLLSVYAALSFRIIPSFNRIFASALQIRSNEYVIQELQDIRSSPEPGPIERHASTTFIEKIELLNIDFGYQDQPLLLKNASLTIHKGEKIILLGKSGTGKTSLFLLMLRFIREQNGEIRIDGEPLREDANIRHLTGYVSQNPYLLDASIRENIAFGVPPEEINDSKINKIVSDLDLEKWVGSLPGRLHSVIGEKGTKVSGGQRQRLAIARALYHDAEILLLDEITNQLDYETELEVMRALENLSKLQKTIILITHRPELWTSFDTVYELKDRKFQVARVKAFQSTV
jgi:ATP-binding cassette, subfamily B, bacterial PglK